MTQDEREQWEVLLVNPGANEPAVEAILDRVEQLERELAAARERIEDLGHELTATRTPGS